MKKDLITAYLGNTTQVVKTFEKSNLRAQEIKDWLGVTDISHVYKVLKGKRAYAYRDPETKHLLHWGKSKIITPDVHVEPECDKEPTVDSKEVVKANTLPLLREGNYELLNGTVIVFSDSHILPNQPMSEAAAALLKVVAALKPSIIIDNGDLLDFASISRHDKLGWEEGFSVEEELIAGMTFLRQLQKASPSSLFLGIQSNHIDRYNNFLVKHCPQFRNVKGFKYEDQLPPGWNYHLSIRLNKNTMFLHQYHSGVHSAYNNVVKGGLNMITSHTHKMEVKPYTDYNGTRYGVQTGTLATIRNNPFFNYTMGTPLDWRAGFVVLTYINGELQTPEMCEITKQGAFFRGELI